MVLQDGRVLLVGSDFTNSAELYEPASGNFTLTGTATDQRLSGLTATLLRDGRVLVAGGLHFTATSLESTASAEIYNPSTGTFSATDSLSIPRWYATATLLRDGRVLVVGGGPSKTPELYDPTTDTFSPTGDALYFHSRHAAALLPTGDVLIVDGFSRTAEIYDWRAGRFRDTGHPTLVGGTRGRRDPAERERCCDRRDRRRRSGRHG